MAGNSMLSPWPEGLRTLLVVSLGFLVTTTDAADSNNTKVLTLLSRETSVERSEEGVLKLLPHVSQTLQLIGINFGDESEIAFISPAQGDKRDCDKSKRTGAFELKAVNSARTSAVVEVTLSQLNPGEEKYYLCVKQSQSQNWEFQGSDPWQQITIKEVLDVGGTLMPMPVQIVLIVFLLFLSGLFSGLNLGLMALDKTELKIIEKCGSVIEKKHAKSITPLRKRGNFLLCTLLLGNVMVNNTATILLDNLSNGVIAVVVSTMCIVVFGEIIPQAVCSRHGLAVGAKTAYITRFFMIVTFPLSFPISLLLDKILGEEIGQVYNKEKLQELIRMTADHKVLQNDEANIIAGALQLANKRVDDVMTKIEDVYMLDVNTVLDFEMMSKILKSGFTRVPVFDGDKTNIVHLLNTKELALIDPDNNTPLLTVCRFYNHQPLFVDYDMKLDAMLQDFLQGKSHMAIVQCLKNEGDHDPYYENTGVVTLEDVIEEIIQSEIIDETDILTDNRKKKPREQQRQRQLDYDVFDQNHEHGPRISQQVAFAAFQFLSTAVVPFNEEHIASSVLKQLIHKNILITMSASPEDGEKKFIYRQDKDCDYFVLLLEGHVEVEIGKENLVFECGPFNFFGVESLNCLQDITAESLRDGHDLRQLPPYRPDYSVRVLSAVQFLRIRRLHYLAARRTSCMMVAHSGPLGDERQAEAFHREWHRTLAGSLSRNCSVAAMNDVGGGGGGELSPLEVVQKRALPSEGSLKDRVVVNCSVHASSSSPSPRDDELDDKGGGGGGSSSSHEGGGGGGAEDKGSAASLRTHSSSRGSLPGDGGGGARPKTQTPPPRDTGAVGAEAPARREGGGEGEDVHPSPRPVSEKEVQVRLLDRAEAAAAELSPDEGGVGDTVPLVSVRDHRAPLTGQKGLADQEEDEQSPLVSTHTQLTASDHC